MPKGQKLIDWTPENNAKLMLTILVIENIYPNCEKVAAAFGGAVNAIAISNRLSRLRKKAADDGLMPKAGVTVPAKGSKGTAVSKKWNGGKMGGMVAEGPEGENDPSDRKGSHSSSIRKRSAKSQKVLTGRVTKARTPGKKNVKSSDIISNNVEVEIGDYGLHDDRESRIEDGDEFEKKIALRIKKKDVD